MVFYHSLLILVKEGIYVALDFRFALYGMAFVSAVPVSALAGSDSLFGSASWFASEKKVVVLMAGMFSLVVILSALLLREYLLRRHMLEALSLADWDALLECLDTVSVALADYQQTGRLLEFFRGVSPSGGLNIQYDDEASGCDSFYLTWANPNGEMEKRLVKNLSRNRSVYEALALREQKAAKIRVIEACELIRRM